ncbi:LsmAD domain-containing protein [Halteromyces radiatus]|uniref:LsmAD domain-containing protein n=1 Tax=Halteromyces radiatus TaxID=101107 RepID=UPI0022204559|nr:LsmAD domain-containing protein [Halteromyces radiatus]KAI8078829.1 LsmAD domain-containing protein [Halteromyces radiatus]
MLFLLGNLYGSKVQVTVRNGTKFEGIFQGATTEGDLGISLTLARKIFDPNTPTDKSKSSPYPVSPALLIFSKDLVEINAMDTDLTAGEISRHERDSFKTDTDISGKGEIKERELHKWNPELPESVFESLEGELESNNDGGSWDQFAANEKLFGLKTDFDEELYTTRLDRSAPDFKDREKWAIEKANEIQRSTTNNPHMLEERNITVADDSGMDEEDRYGAVVRDVNPNVYIPPALRKQLQQQKPQDQTGSFSNLPPDSPLHKLTTGTLTNTSARNEPGKKKSTEKQAAPKRIESEIANTFRQFAMLEKDKLQAKRQALHKKEQSDRLADLVKFHQTFKLNVPVPPDLLPLLAKGKKSPTSSSATGSEPSEKSSSSPDTTPQATKAPSSPSKTDTNDKKPSFRFNIKASEFKPNAAASVFVPGGKLTTSTDDTNTFAGRSLKKGNLNDPVTIDEVFKAPFTKGKYKKPNTIGPTWPYGSGQYRHQFHQYSEYSEGVFTGYPAPAYGYGYPQYRYHQQYVPGMSAIPVQQQNVSYMSPQFVPNVPITAAPMHHGGGYSPQMPNGSPHGSPFPQGFSSPQRSPMPPPNGAPPQVYQYQGNPSPGGSMPVRYTPDMMTPPSGTPVMMQQQRPVMADHPSPSHYSPGPPPPMNRPHEQMNSRM